jgi:hypothetical protein
MRFLSVAFAAGVGILIVLVVQLAGEVDVPRGIPSETTDEAPLGPAVDRLDASLEARWSSENVRPAYQADELTILRRLSLALFGTVPSLEEIRGFEADNGPDRIDRWVSRMLQDTRYSDYFAERLVRSLVSAEQGPFIVFRRDRLREWLAEQLRNDASWAEMTRQMIAAEGLWTDQPAANFITNAQVPDVGLDANKLAGRTVRTFLGQRIDCAQCHDHPFDPEWKQAHFEGLAAWYGQAAVTAGGVGDRAFDDQQQSVEFKVVDPGMMDSAGRVVAPAVPFHDDWLAAGTSRRQQLAGWITHPENRRFERAIANRVWGLMFGRPWHDPVDDLPHPVDGEEDALDILGQEFRRRGDRLSTLIRMIALSRAFQLKSESDAATDSELEQQTDAWAVFPLVRLRPEQVIGSLFQAGHVRSIDQASNVFIRFQKFGNENDFLNEYGDLGDEELLQQTGTIPQALLRMNGRFTRELSEVGLLTAAGEIMAFSSDDNILVENCFLACLTRRPSDDESNWFQQRLSTAAGPDNDDSSSRQSVVEDLFWVLFNSPEFSWNH